MSAISDVYVLTVFGAPFRTAFSMLHTAVSCDGCRVSRRDLIVNWTVSNGPVEQTRQMLVCFLYSNCRLMHLDGLEVISSVQFGFRLCANLAQNDSRDGNAVMVANRAQIAFIGTLLFAAVGRSPRAILGNLERFITSAQLICCPLSSAHSRFIQMTSLGRSHLKLIAPNY